jgi:hypothetical protein
LERQAFARHPGSTKRNAVGVSLMPSDIIEDPDVLLADLDDGCNIKSAKPLSW